MTQFKLSQVQAQAILDMQLQRLTGLERQKIIDELAEVLKLIERLRAILSSDELLMQVVRTELTRGARPLRRRAPDRDPRRSGELRIEDLIADEDMAITVTNTGYVKRTAISTYRAQRRGGKGRIGMRTREEDFVTHLFVASTHAYLMIFSTAAAATGSRSTRFPTSAPAARASRSPTWSRWKKGRRSRRCSRSRTFHQTTASSSS